MTPAENDGDKVPELSVRLARLLFVTASVKVLEPVAELASVACSVTMAVPVSPATGVAVTVLVVPEPETTRRLLGSKVWLLDVAVTETMALSTSVTVKGNAPVLVLGKMDCAGTCETTGGSFTAVTVSRKVSLRCPPSVSVTVTVMVLVPLASGAGKTVRVRVEPVPASTRLAALFGTRDVLLEVAVTTSDEIAVSTSPIVKLSGPVPPTASSVIVWFEMSLMAGRSLIEVTVNKN